MDIPDFFRLVFMKIAVGTNSKIANFIKEIGNIVG